VEDTVTVIDTRMSVWEALAGRAPGRPVGPADPGLWHAVAERLNPARTKPVLRRGIEEAHLVSVRGVAYVMLRSPDGTNACYLRLAPEELELARLMDGTRTVARLVAEFARITGRLAPDQVTRVVADLAGNRMLEELPVDAFRRLQRVHRRPWPVRLGRAAIAFARGRRVIIARIDPLIGLLYRAGGRLFFTRFVAVLVGLVAAAGLGIFGWAWVRGAQPVFAFHGSYATGALVLLDLNVLALACHELGHALATRHAGRRVPAAGLLVYFGIPSVFVDTTDVWMAGRRARLVTTAAGPATGLFLAGVAQVVGLLDPALAPWTFKLSFAWYVNAAFNLNPFLALDGYYLLMDWLEVPNLRARGLSWIIARLRRRPPRFGQLDREGRLVALYGMLSVAWLAIAANLAYRVYLDRVDGLIVGLWRAGWWQRALLAAVIAGLAAPMVWVLFGWLGRRRRRLWQRLRERRLAADAPRRADGLARSVLGRLPARALTRLAADARWVRPRTGEQLVFAGAGQQSVYVVVDGALEARRPGDPTGTVRERVGAGGVVGLANALTGAASALAWYTAGTTLLAVPVSVVAAEVGPLANSATSGRPIFGADAGAGFSAFERAEIEGLFDSAPALAGLSIEDKLALMSRARPYALPPGSPLVLAGANDAAVVSAGALGLRGGGERRRGELVGPLGVELPGAIATARTPARVWVLPAVAGLPLLLGGQARPTGGSPGHHAPAFGAHPPSGYPPLAAPPGPPPSNSDDDKDRRFERRLWWLLILLLLLALLLTGMNLLAGLPAWSEMPADHALLQAQRGTVTAVVGGRPVTLHKGDKVYVSAKDTVAVGQRSTGLLTFRGGGYTVLCGESGATVGPLASSGYPVAPVGTLRLDVGTLLADTAATSRAFLPLALTLTTGGAQLANSGAARFAAAGGDADVSSGTVLRDSVRLPVTGDDLSCGDGTALSPPAPSGSPSASSSPSDLASPSALPSLTPSTTPSPAPSPSPSRATRRSSSPSPTNKPSPTPAKTTSPPPPPDQAPVVQRGPVSEQAGIFPSGYVCGPHTATIDIYVFDPDNSHSELTVSGTWSGGGASGSFALNYVKDQAADAWLFQGVLGPVSSQAQQDATISVAVTVSDGKKSASGATSLTLYTVCIT
jgi:putative peptide zinc metalloprotease protein